jgi:hypothetical protein
MDTSAFRKVDKMDNTTKIQQELEKYKAVLKNVKKYKDGFMATCPNEDAHNWKKENRPPTQNFQILIQKTKEPNKEKFGEYMVVYRCHAHADGPCSNKVLAKIFKEHGIQSHSYTRKSLAPEVFPKGDDSYLRVNRIGERNSGLYFYKSTEEEGVEFLVWVLEDHITKKKKFFQLSYSKFAREHPDLKGEGGWVEANLWETKAMYKQHEMWLQKKNTCIIVDEEPSVAIAEELFPDYFITCCSGGASGWRTSWINNVVRFNDIICFPKNTTKYKKEFNELALYISDRVKIRVVDLPRELPLEWNLTQPIPDYLDLDELIAKAKPPKRREKNDYSNIDEDNIQGRWSHLEDSRRYHYDHFKNKITHNDNINLWYENDTSTRRDRRLSPVRYLHREGCDRAQGLAFIPNEEKIIWENGKKYINSYVPFKHKELTQEELDSIDLSDFFLQLEIVCNYDKKIKDYFLDVIAFTIQQPADNLKFATLVVSPEEGTGKTNIWKCIERMHGGMDYCMWVNPEQLTSKLGKSWLKECVTIFCNEVRVVGTQAQKKAQIDILKSLITEDTHTIEPKGIDPYQIKNNFNCFLSSNDDVQELIGSKSTRRYFVVNCPLTVEEIEEKHPTIFKDMIKFYESKDKISRLYYYFSKEHKISKDFKSWKPMITEAKLTMARAIRPQIFKDLDEMRVRREGPFMVDLVNTRAIQDFCKNLDKNNKTKDWIGLDENKLNSYLLSVGKRLKNGEPIQLDGKRKRGWWAIREIDYWVKLSSLTNHRLHLAGKFFVPDFRNKQEELEIHAPQGALPKTKVGKR